MRTPIQSIFPDILRESEDYSVLISLAEGDELRNRRFYKLWTDGIPDFFRLGEVRFQYDPLRL